jgi:hypothetical protein
MQTPADPPNEDYGLGAPTNRKKGEDISPAADESKYVWRDLKPGFEINQHGHIRTKNYTAPSTPWKGYF